MKILHTPKNVGCNPGALAKAERTLGLCSFSVAIIGSKFKFVSDKVIWEHGESPLKLEFFRWRFFLSSIFKYKIFHFNFGMTFTPEYCPLERPWRLRNISPFLWWIYRFYSNFLELKDLFLLKLLGKKVVVTFQGSDVRQNDYCREHFEITHSKVLEYNQNEKLQDEAKRRKIKIFHKYADAIFALNPDLLRILPENAKFVPYAHVNPKDWEPSFPDFSDNHVPVLLHAPSDRLVKGSDAIFAAVERLKADGLKFEFLLVENIPHDEAIKLYGRADILIDQLLVGWYGGLAVELMALGKPVLCYIREDDLKYIPEGMKEDMPIINVTIDTLYDKLKYLLTDGKQDLKETGVRSRAYIEKWHDPQKIAQMMKETYEKI